MNLELAYLAREINRTSVAMDRMANEMRRAARTMEVSIDPKTRERLVQHATEMAGAATIAREWAWELEKEAEK